MQRFIIMATGSTAAIMFATTALSYTPETTTLQPGMFDDPGSAIHLTALTSEDSGINSSITDQNGLTLVDFRGGAMDLFGDKAWKEATLQIDGGTAPLATHGESEVAMHGGGTLTGPGTMIESGTVSGADLMAYLNDVTTQGTSGATGHFGVYHQEANAIIDNTGQFDMDITGAVEEANARLGDHGTFEAPAGSYFEADMASLSNVDNFGPATANAIVEDFAALDETKSWMMDGALGTSLHAAG